MREPGMQPVINETQIPDSSPGAYTIPEFILSVKDRKVKLFILHFAKNRRSGPLGECAAAALASPKGRAKGACASIWGIATVALPIAMTG